MIDYVSDNKAAMCNCPHQCRHLAYKHDISQAMFSDYLMESTMDLLRPILRANITTDEFRRDYCILQVTRCHVLSLIILWTHITRHLQRSDAVVRFETNGVHIKNQTAVKNENVI